MFKASQNEQLELFKDILNQLPKAAANRLDDTSAWNSVFYSHYTSKIEEQPYSVLFSSDHGRPNAPVRIILAMMLLKELNGWSDEQLFDECMFNIRARLALGIRKLETKTPVASTYYEFRAKVARHLELHGQDLVAQTFSQVCASQIKDLEINGNKVRMDSKLIQSNIVKQNRLQLVVEAVRVFLKTIKVEVLQPDLNEEQYELLEKLAKCSTSNLCYVLDAKEKQTTFLQFGQIVMRLIDLDYICTESILYKIFHEQYECSTEERQSINEAKTKGENKAKGRNENQSNPKDGVQGDNQTELRGEDKTKRQNENQTENKDKAQGNNKLDKKVTAKDPKEIASGSIQSVHDPDAAYRTKGKDQMQRTVNGYHTNIVETCDQSGKPNLITDVITDRANESECHFLIKGIANTNKVLGSNQVKQVITDGGYDSKSNRAVMSEEQAPQWHLQKLKGNKRAYKMRYKESGVLEVVDAKTDKPLEVTWSERAKKYRIKNAKGYKYYITKKEVENYIRDTILASNLDKHSYNLRASVESTIHEVFHRLCKRHKTRYRGIAKTHWYALMRAMAVNIGRIARHKSEKELELVILTTRYLMSLVNCVLRFIHPVRLIKV